MVLFNQKRNRMKETTKEAAERMSTRVMEILFKDEKKWQQERSYSEEDFKIWDDLFGILAWKFKPTKSGDMYLDGEKVYEELKSKFKLKRI